MMLEKHWFTFDPPLLTLLPEATEQVHRAAQYLAMAGKFFLPHLPDDSHTNMGWDLQNRWFVGHPLPTQDKHMLALQPEGLRLLLLDGKQQILHALDLIGKPRQQGLEWVKEHLSLLGLNSSAYTIDLHYEIPDHELHHGAPFKQLTKDAYRAFSNARSIGQVVMSEVANTFEHASSVRTWPHHFDIGSYIPLELDNQGKPIKSLTIGLAIHDKYVPDHYFYLTHWSKEGGVTVDELPSLPSGACWNRKDFTAAILPFSELIQAGRALEQIKLINTFMNEGIQASIHLLQLHSTHYLS